jgi:hypothetical protein
VTLATWCSSYEENSFNAITCFCCFVSWLNWKNQHSRPDTILCNTSRSWSQNRWNCGNIQPDALPNQPSWSAPQITNKSSFSTNILYFQNFPSRFLTDSKT